MGREGWTRLTGIAIALMGIAQGRSECGTGPAGSIEPQIEIARADPPAAEGNSSDKNEDNAAKGPVAEKLAKFQDLLRTEAKSQEHINELLVEIVNLAEEISKDPRATEEEKGRGYRGFLGNLAYGALVGVKGFDERLRTEASRLAKEKPDDEATAYAAYQLLRLDHRGPTGRVKPEALEAVLQLNDKYSKFPGFGSKMLLEVSESAEEGGDGARAIRALRLIKEKYPQSNEIQFADDATIHRIETLGKPFVFEGTLLDGKPLDPEVLKGKVVIVDFWATWCGPCVAEIPNLRKLYEEYHDKGLEIVGVSLDREKGVLDTFVDEKEIPWIQTFEDTSDKPDHPIASKYGIIGIPTMFLIDRDGKLIATKLRGPTLESKVRELMGDAKASEKGK